MYESSAPFFVYGLNTLSQILAKGEAFAKEKKIDPSKLINARLAPDMFPLAKQIMIATDIAKTAVSRLAGREITKCEDTESTFEGLQARLAKTRAFIESVPASAIDGSEDRNITHVGGGGVQRNFLGQRYLTYYAVPNFLFHVVTAYDILRHSGVPLGKPDFLGPLPTVS
jgi:hypothetical protein